MSNPLSPWMVRCVELLGNGEWRERDWIVAEAAKRVPPGRAKRVAERLRARQQLREVGEIRPRSRPKSDEFLIRVGARRVVYDSLIASTRLEHKKTEDGVRWVRLKETQ